MPAVQRANIQRELNHAQQQGWLAHFVRASESHGVSVPILLGVASRETRVGTSSYLTSNWTGDHGHGRGLMQIDDRYHKVFVSTHSNDDHAANIDYAASLLADCRSRFPNNRTAALACYNAGPSNVRRALAAGRSADARTTGGNYGADVQARAEVFATLLPPDVAGPKAPGEGSPWRLPLTAWGAPTSVLIMLVICLGFVLSRLFADTRFFNLSLSR